MKDLQLWDAVRDIMRRLNVAERALAYIPVRHAHQPLIGLANATADELIDANGSGPFTMNGSTVTLENPFGYPLWEGTTVVVDLITRAILFDNACLTIQAAYVSGTATLVASYGTFSPAGPGHFNDTGLNDTNFVINDPAGVLSGIAASDVITFAVLASGGSPPNELRPISSDDGTGGGVPWPPGPAPGAGTETLTLLFANVDEATDVASGDATFAFAGATVAGSVGTAPGGGSGTCQNPGHAFADNEPILVAGDGTTWVAIKLATNWIRATVNQSGGVDPADGTFTFDGVNAIVGVGPGASPPTANNTCNLRWEDNEEFEAYQRDDGEWEPIKLQQPTYKVRGIINSGAVTSATGTFTINTLVAVQGALPSFTTLTIKNDPPIDAPNGTEIEVAFDITAHATDFDKQWNTDCARNTKWILRGLPNFNASLKLVLTSDAGTVEWNPVDTVVNWLAGYTAGDDQSIGHDASGSTEWQDDATCS